MKTFLYTAGLGLLLLGAGRIFGAENSQGLYRIPYATGTEVQVTGDHLTHNPENRIDMRGINGSGTYRVVAAGDGVIRYIVDHHTITCTTNGCSQYNNYVWIEHPNGEWTKYSHMRTGTTTGAASLSVGQHVCAGTYLGDEGEVGHASGQHLHFEVAVPDDRRDPINESGGFIKGINLVPRICGIEDSTLVDGQTYVAEPCEKIQMARGVYRIPYLDGTQVRVGGDHISHANVPTRIDMSGTGGRGAYTIVAAADGIIRAIMETNTITCTTNGCTKYNNYVWIEHPNGEWTKYSHMLTGSTTAAGRYVGEPVCAGTVLGIEDDVGAASGKHLHWEVGVPNDPADAFSVSGGFLRGANRIPVICGIPGNIFVDGQTYTAGPCKDGDCVPKILLAPQAIHEAKVLMAADQIDSDMQTVTVASCGIVSLSAGHKITLRPGFRANYYSWLHASIRDCHEMQRLPGCLPLVIGQAAPEPDRAPLPANSPVYADGDAR
jgi:murein DD-endopeptidase MepM/ murein hydrolase activator NlpD